jgi:hypothetical protein
VVDRIADRLRIAHTVVTSASQLPTFSLAAQALPRWQQVIRPLCANLNWKSPAPQANRTSDSLDSDKDACPARF